MANAGIVADVEFYSDKTCFVLVDSSVLVRKYFWKFFDNFLENFCENFWKNFYMKLS